MTQPGKASSIAVHPARAEIERALKAGEPYRSISAKFHVSRSALSRFSLSRAPMARIIDDEPNVTDVVKRLADLTDDARSLRLTTRQTANPPARARAIKTEMDALAHLANHLGIDDVAVVEFFDEATEIARTLQKFVERYPAQARPLLALLHANKTTGADFASALEKHLGASDD